MIDSQLMKRDIFLFQSKYLHITKDLKWNLNSNQQLEITLDTFSLLGILPTIGGLWVVISICFGAIIFLILRNSFWKEFASTILKKRLKRHEGGVHKRQSSTNEQIVTHKVSKRKVNHLVKQLRKQFSYENMYDVILSQNELESKIKRIETQLIEQDKSIAN